MGNLDGLGYRDATVVVTGASSGMGQAAATILGELGAAVHVVDIAEPSVPCASFHATDLADPDQVATTAAALRGVGPIDFLFNCAGVAPLGGPQKTMLINYVGPRQLTDALLPVVADGGSITWIASLAGAAWQRHLAANLELLEIADPRAAAAWCEAHPEHVRDGYTVSKEMIITWVMHRAITLAERGIRTNCIAPCPTGTAFADAITTRTGSEYFDHYPYPLLGRMATAEEQAWPLVMLASPRNAVVTGTVLYTDQGFAGGWWTGSLDVTNYEPTGPD